MRLDKKKTAVAIAIVTVVAASAVFFLATSGCSVLSPNDLDMALERSVNRLVEEDISVQSCVLAVSTGDGSYTWSGAAGIANRKDQVPMTRYTPVYIASVTKLYTAAAVMRLYEAGELSLDDPIYKYLSPEVIQGIHVYQGIDYSDNITIRELLSHSSGIADYYTEKGTDDKTLFDLFVEDPEKKWTVGDTIKRAQSLPGHFTPGTGVYYSDTNYQLLGLIIENVTEKSLGTVYEEFFFRPLDLNHTWLIGCSEPAVASPAPADLIYNDAVITKTRLNGAYWADGGIVSTADDMITFLKALNEGKIISRNSLQMMHEWRDWEFPIKYGYGTMYFELPRIMSKVTGLTPIWGHSGTSGAFLFYSEDLDIYLAGSINSADSNSKPFFTLIKDTMMLFNSKCRN